MSKKDVFIVVSVWIACLTVFLIGVYFLEVSDTAALAEAQEEKHIDKKEPVVKYGLLIDSMNVIQDTVKKNENFSTILEKYHVPDSFLSELSLKTEDDKDF